jgi:dUTP pyrophosphatase
MKVKIKRLPHADGLALPAYQTEGAAGFDLVAAIAPETTITIAPGARALIPTGLIFELPKKSEAQVRPRSGLAIKHGVTVLNSPGTIDSDYRGEVAVILINLGNEPFLVKRGERIAQVVIAPVVHAKLKEAKEISETKRGAGGFGSTGTGETPSHRDRHQRKLLAEAGQITKTKSRKAKRRSSR